MKIFKSIIPFLVVALAIFFIPACAAEPSVVDKCTNFKEFFVFITI